MYLITDTNNIYTLATFAFSVPKPRLTPSGFKTVKPRLLKQANTAKLKRPGMSIKKPGIIRPMLPRRF